MKRTWRRERADGIEMQLRVHPGSHSNQVVGPYGDRPKLNIASLPIGGKANEALISFLARESPPADRKSKLSPGIVRATNGTPYQAPVWCGSDPGT